MTTPSQPKNPLLDFSGLPHFHEVRPEHVSPAVDELLQHNRDIVKLLLEDTTPPTWENFVLPLDDANEKMSRSWGQVSHLNAVMNSEELRVAYNANLPKITQYYAELGQNLALFVKYKAMRASKEYDGLSPARKKILEHELRDFRLSGAELPEDKKARFLEIQEEMSALCSRFSDNLLDAGNDYHLLITDKTELSGIPEDDLQAAAETADKMIKELDDRPLSERGSGDDLLAGSCPLRSDSGVGEAAKNGWMFTLKAPSYMPVLQYAENRELRELLYVAYSQRASEFGKAEWDNTPLITKILKLRAEEAQLLGYANYAELSLTSKMANTPEQILKFLRELAQHARPLAEKDLSELREFAKAELAMEDLQSWDIGYVSEKLRQKRYAFSEQDVKQYFPEDVVIAGMFNVVQKIYGLSLRASSAPVWHETVRFFDVYDADDKLIGQFYIDLYARNSKRGGAWMDDAITRRRITSSMHVPHGIQTPVAYLNCNFAPPVGGKPALFTHDDVITLFHEFGHGLHHLLTEVEELGVSGINGVEWDAVELPSQFMENFCWEWDVLRHMTRHVANGEPLPRALFDKMLLAKNFQSGMQTVRQIELALYDMHLHFDFDPSDNPLALLQRIRDRVAVVQPPAYNRLPNNFSHIFAGGYAAGYYSYKWAEVLSADAYSLFEENGVLSSEAGHRFWSEILGRGGSRPALESFIAFRGREPTIDALLRHSGMVAA